MEIHSNEEYEKRLVKCLTDFFAQTTGIMGAHDSPRMVILGRGCEPLALIESPELADLVSNLVVEVRPK
jgi:hypothetical protein